MVPIWADGPRSVLALEDGQESMRTGLILEGGGMRGMFTCGVLDVFMEEGVAFDGAAGISAGAVFGCNYKSRQKGRALRYNKTYGRAWRYCSLRSLILTGDLYGADFCYRKLPDELDVFDRAAFRENPMAFYAGAADVETGKTVYHRCGDGGKEDMLWLRASASMPVVSRPVEIGGRRYLDGGVADPVPYAFMEKEGYDRNVAILTQPRGYVKKPSPGAMGVLLRKYPAIRRAMEERHAVYNRQMEEIGEREKAGRLLVIRPARDLGIRRTERDPQALQRAYDAGREEGFRRLNEVKAYLKG